VRVQEAMVAVRLVCEELLSKNVKAVKDKVEELKIINECKSRPQFILEMSSRRSLFMRIQQLMDANEAQNLKIEGLSLSLHGPRQHLS
jgi:hypothetical protein